ncbi:MAG: carboxypeptidase regulatory-like domain-containing protein [Saprospiraceae bacterium]|nr:carboxypeptidase regulatory-like domain-containing protein [Saprospiraceae bacterium]
MNRLLLLVGFFLVVWSGTIAQTTIEGKVIDGKTNEPILFGTVALFRGGVIITGTETDLDGNFFISNIQPGTYDMEASYVGYATQRLTGIVMKAGKTNRVNFTLSDDAILIDLGIEIKAYKIPLIEFDNTTQGNTVTAEKIRALPTKNVNAIAATSAGISSRDGGDISVRGSRSNETVYFLDGVRVSGNLIPQSEIEQLQVVIGGIEARYGDVTGGIISLTSRGPSNQHSGSLELEKSVDGYGYNLISGNISGPILRNSKKQSILGYRFSGQYRDVADNTPSAIGVYRAPKSLIEQLEKAPTYNIGDTRFPSLELIKSADLGKTFKARPNDQNVDLDLTGRLDFKLSDNIDIQLSGNYNDKTNRFTAGSSGVEGSGASWALLNWINNPYQYSNTYRGNFRFTHKLGKQGATQDGDNATKSSSNLRNVSYTITLGYQKATTRSEDFRHEDRLFNYGYFGKTSRDWVKTFGRLDQNGPLTMFGYREVLGETTLIDPNVNPVLASYNAINGIAINGLLNQNVNSAWSDLFANVGQVYNQFDKSDNDLYSLNLVTGFDFLPGGSEKGRHNIQFGMIYEQSINRNWSLNPFQLWRTAEQLTNNHIIGLDTLNILGDTMITTVFPGGSITETVNIYQTKLDINSENKFYRSVRELTGKTDNDYVNVWDVDPSKLRLDMFSASELNNQQGLIDYSGYDYLGNKLGSDVRFEDFFTSKDASGRRSFVVAPQQPIYGAVFVQDKFSYKDIIFRLGLRVDYFDANTKVQRDPYALYEIETAKDFYSRTVREQPSSVADDYKVYVKSDDSDDLVAFRKGDQWFQPNGTAVSGGNVIYQGGLVYPSYAGRTQGRVLNIQTPGFDPNTAFVDYKPQVNLMPRLAFSFPISDDAGFFAHYDVLYQRPPSNSFSSALDYYFFQDISRTNPGGGSFNNPNLKPVRTVDYEVGFQQKVSETMAMKVSAYYKEMKDLVQQRVFANVAAPLNTYKMFDNLDFGTVKGFSFSLDRRRTNNLEINATYTLQFADGSGSDANSSNGINNRGPIKNLIPLSFDERHRITAVLDYRYGSGKAYDGPKIGNVNIFEDFGISLTSFLVSGGPYSRNLIPQAFGGSGFAGSINGARLPWNFTMDLNIQKRFSVSLSKTSVKKLFFNAYFRVQNVLNTLNVVDLFKYSSDPKNDGFLTSSFGEQRENGVVNTGRDLQAFRDAYAWRLLSPGNYTLPRRMYVGVIMDF